MATTWLNWPYAALAVVTWEYVTGNIYVWLTFRHAMDQTVTPDAALFTVKIPAGQFPVFAPTWLDDWQLQVFVLSVGPRPARLQIRYDGPTPDLRTSWGKQWEPWGWLLGMDLTTP